MLFCELQQEDEWVKEILALKEQGMVGTTLNKSSGSDSYLVKIVILTATVSYLSIQCCTLLSG